jgi:hypothetical protein
MATFVLMLMIALIAAGILWSGETAGAAKRIWHDLAERPSGPMALRFALQPGMAAIAAIYDGIEDARSGRAAYLRTIVTDPQQRWPLLSEGLVSTARTVFLCMLADAIYQLEVLGRFYPFEAVLVAILLAMIPYLLIRDPVAHIARCWQRAHAADRLLKGGRR